MKIFPTLAFLFLIIMANGQELRTDISLNEGWKTIADDKSADGFSGFEVNSFEDNAWQTVDVPHNWDDYAGYRTLKHGNRHGYAWYRREFTVPSNFKDKQVFLWFEGVGSYATVWINGTKAGYHAGGRTTFTIDITSLVNFGKSNLLSVRADHPSNIQDLPWVCGGCSSEAGFSEGSQPMGIFRPVHLIATSPIRIEPFGVHVWNDNRITENSALLNIETEVRNYTMLTSAIKIISRLVDRNGTTIAKTQTSQQARAGISATVSQHFTIKSPHLWSPNDPFLYTLESEIWQGEKIIDQISTPYGIRWLKWSSASEPDGQRLLINGKPIFINGNAEYEHFLGQSHAFTSEQINTRVNELRAAGFNAFRDAHQPHNLRYQANWDSLGILWWPQMAAHIWYDTPEFRNNFKKLMIDWIKERRNSPSIILWGLENESSLPQSFAEECSNIIRKMDPTASSQRLITTCNGGKGTDWNVPQNWTGTYGGNPAKYAEELQKQKFVGEYGAWRNVGLHSTEADPKGSYSEEYMTQLMELKIRLADSVKDKVYGHFHWLLNSHENPGRYQNGESYRNLDRVGPVNYKGLFTAWDEPADVFYMFRSNFVSKEKEPMVYIVSHTWPDRWTSPGIKSGITVYSNCVEVELFNDIKSISLGTRKRGGVGTHFEWNQIPVLYNILYAEGRMNGKVVASDYIVLNHLPHSPKFGTLYPEKDTILSPKTEYNYLYRVNCGGAEYKDHQGNQWLADVPYKGSGWGSLSWADTCSTLPSGYASVGNTSDAIAGTTDWILFQTFRFGRHKLQYQFPVPDGKYRIELYFTEPWYGTDGGLNCNGWRLFDVAVNGNTVINNLDLWSESGHDHAVKKVIYTDVKGGKLVLSFPKVKSGQAIISAIAIASLSKEIVPALPSKGNVNLWSATEGTTVQRWLNTGDKVFSNDISSFSRLPAELYGDEWIRTPVYSSPISLSFSPSSNMDVYLPIDTTLKEHSELMNSWTKTDKYIETDEKGGTRYLLLNKSFQAGDTVKVYSGPVFVHRKTALELPPPTARPSATYEAEEAKTKGTSFANVKPDFSGTGYIEFSANADTVEWLIAVGVGDTYTLRFKYTNPTAKDLVATVEVIDKDDNVLNTGTVYFSPSGEVWDKVLTTTGTNINAGNYRIRLTIINAKGLVVDNLKVQ